MPMSYSNGGFLFDEIYIFGNKRNLGLDEIQLQTIFVDFV